MSRIELTREVLIRAIHNLENLNLSEDENRKLYGICYRQHGHHYKVRVTVTAPLDPASGWMVDRDWLDSLLKREIVDWLDGVDLNEIFANSSCEALAYELHAKLKPFFAPSAGSKTELVRVGVQETRRNYFEFPAAGAADATE